MTTTSSSSLTSTDLQSSLHLFEVKPGVQFSHQVLKEIFDGDIETALFFGAVYELSYAQLSALIVEFFKTDLVSALFGGDHSTDLQDYLVDELSVPADVDKGQISFDKNVHPKGEILPHVWASLQLEVAQSIKDVAAKLKDVVGLMPGKQGQMTFRSLMAVNAKRPVLGDFRAQITHAPVKDNLVILDVSGSMSEHTVRAIINDVIDLSFMANAHLAIVSNTTTHWNPGEYKADVVLKAAQFGGTHYETLHPLFDRDWGVVVTIADYDSSLSAKRSLASKVTGVIDTVVDISLVNQPTFLAECVGQFAKEVRPILIAQSAHGLMR